MTPKLSSDSKEIINLLSRLKTQTPDYPAEMLAARKATFLKDAAVIKLQIKGQGGEGGQAGGSGGSSAAAGGSTTASGIAFQAAVGFGLVAALLIGAFFVDGQDRVSLDNTVVAIQENSDELILPLTGAAPLTATSIPTEVIPDTATPEITISDPSIYSGDTEVIYDEIDLVKKLKKPNPGLHLGQAEGTPAAPGLGNPGNINQPEKPDKPDKPKKPEKPGKPNP
jgi:hypothetical protein